MPSRLRRALTSTATVVALVAASGCTIDAKGITEPSAPPGTTATPPPQQVNPVVLGTDRPRASGGVVAAGGLDAVYNYAPTLIVENGVHRMWWCSQIGTALPPGDDVLHAEAPSPNGPFVAPDGSPGMAVFSGSTTGWDGVHTCDPSVIKVAGTYYLYYTGAAGEHAYGNAIGLATSPDGRSWTRANGGQPIVTSANDVGRENTYGAGQPAVVHLDGWFYLMFTDTTGRGAGFNGAGQFVLRSRDPAFGADVEALGEGGFARATGTEVRERSVVDAFSADIMWVDPLNAFAIAHETSDGTTLTFWDVGFTRHPHEPVTIPGPWKEGPGLVRDPEGHALPSLEDPCQRLPVDLVRATAHRDAPTDLRAFGADLTGTAACLDPQRALRTLEGFAMPSPARTVDMVVHGGVVRIERRSVAERLALRILDHRVPALDAVPVAAHLGASATAIESPPRGMGLVLDDKRLWALSDPILAALNASTFDKVSPLEWDAYQRGPDLVSRR
ncbi:glycoside hydrolase family protein [Actinokineospora pegani]|uniref:beta-xylosidase n=1 Tax=Actinokineospora pegani TaxID=2654637 RepID=UPI0012EA8D9A|nr:beta-xylosidase [Actinokineospora pegani]